MARGNTFTDQAFELLSGGGTGEAAQLDAGALAAEPRNFLRHAAALSMTKLADGLLDPKLVLSFLLTALGAPAGFVGALVPVREAGALLPQLFTAARIRAMGRRKWAWVWGSLVQGLAAGAILLAALTLRGAALGVAVVAALAVLAVARSVSSVSYKDVLGKTVGKARRGAVTGLAGSVASAGVIVFALLLMSGQVPRMALVTGAIGLAAAFWLAAGLLFTTLEEEDAPGEADGDGVLGQLRLLWQDRDLGRFVLTRCLLLPTALAPPYLVLLAARAGDDRFQALGAMVLASAAAGFLSAYLWGRLADRSSRKVLMGAGGLAAIFLVLGVWLDRAGLMGTHWAAPLALFGLVIAYQGVRLGRSTYLVDMAPGERRAAYTAVANTVVGIVLLLAGFAGVAASALGLHALLLGFAGLCGLAALSARTLREA